MSLAISRIKILARRALAQIGLREEVGLIPVAIVVGLLASVAAITFHELIEIIKNFIYERRGAEWLYGRGLWMLIAIPAAGGLLVGIITRYIIKTEGSHGVADVIESVLRTKGFARPIVAIEKILTAAVTIGTGGSAGAEGPIIQISAAVSSGVGQFLSISRHRMPLLVGCGTAAGISSIFHAPIGGVLFTLEVILRDFSVRTLVPVIVASVIASVATTWGLGQIDPQGYQAIFSSPYLALGKDFSITWAQASQFLVLGVLCGLVGICTTRALLLGDRVFKSLQFLGAFRPMLGGALVGLLGVGFVLLFGWIIGVSKPIPFWRYPMPAFFGDGYGVVRSILEGSFLEGLSTQTVVALLLTLIVLKIVATSLTLGSGGSGGIIAPSLFLGATSGMLLGAILKSLGIETADPGAMALIGMGAVLAAVVHAPLASILIVMELTQSPGTIVPAMLAVVTAHGIARVILPDSVYTLALRQRGLSPEAAADMTVLRKYAIDQLPLEPLLPLHASDPFQRAIDLASDSDRENFIVTDASGKYSGILTGDQFRTVLLAEQSVPLLTVSEVMRTDVKPMRHTENLASLFEAFLRHDVDAMPIGLDYDPNKIIGIVTRDALMKHYQKHWKES